MRTYARIRDPPVGARVAVHLCINPLKIAHNFFCTLGYILNLAHPPDPL